MNNTEFLIGRFNLDLQDDFYPDDLPSEWRFDYYSNMFKALSLPIDTPEDLDDIFTDIEETDADEPFELVLSITQAQLIDKNLLVELLANVTEHKQSFTLFCEVDNVPSPAVMSLLDGYRVCFQAPSDLKIDLNHSSINGQHLFFNHTPVLFTDEFGDDKQIRSFIENISSINTRTILICRDGKSSMLSKIRVIVELLGF
jgi:hypothetical protein